MTIEAFSDSDWVLAHATSEITEKRKLEGFELRGMMLGEGGFVVIDGESTYVGVGEHKEVRVGDKEYQVYGT